MLGRLSSQLNPVETVEIVPIPEVRQRWWRAFDGSARSSHLCRKSWIFYFPRKISQSYQVCNFDGYPCRLIRHRATTVLFFEILVVQSSCNSIPKLTRCNFREGALRSKTAINVRDVTAISAQYNAQQCKYYKDFHRFTVDSRFYLARSSSVKIVLSFEIIVALFFIKFNRQNTVAGQTAKHSDTLPTRTREM